MSIEDTVEISKKTSHHKILFLKLLKGKKLSQQKILLLLINSNQDINVHFTKETHLVGFKLVFGVCLPKIMFHSSKLFILVN